MMNKRLIIAGNLLLAVCFIADRCLKSFLTRNPAWDFFVLGDWLRIRLSYNSGVAFGLELNYYLILAVYLVFLAALGWLAWSHFSNKKLITALCAEAIIVGALSNLWDRLQYGRVIDYIDVKYFSVFNLADSMIVLGVIAFFIFDFKKSRAHQNAEH